MLFSAHRFWGQIWKYPSKQLGPFINISIHLSIHHVIHGRNECNGCLDRFVVAKHCEGKGTVLLWVLSGAFTIYQPSFGGYAIYFDLPICGSIDINTSKVIIMHNLVLFQVFQMVQLYKKTLPVAHHTAEASTNHLAEVMTCICKKCQRQQFNELMYGKNPKSFLLVYQCISP